MKYMLLVYSPENAWTERERLDRRGMDCLHGRVDNGLSRSTSQGPVHCCVAVASGRNSRKRKGSQRPISGDNWAVR